MIKISMGKTLYLGDTFVQHIRQIPDVAPLRSFLHSNSLAKLPFATEEGESVSQVVKKWFEGFGEGDASLCCHMFTPACSYFGIYFPPFFSPLKPCLAWHFSSVLQLSGPPPSPCVVMPSGDRD